ARRCPGQADTRQSPVGESGGRGLVRGHGEHSAGEAGLRAEPHVPDAVHEAAQLRSCRSSTRGLFREPPGLFHGATVGNNRRSGAPPRGERRMDPPSYPGTGASTISRSWPSIWVPAVTITSATTPGISAKIAVSIFIASIDRSRSPR